METMSLLAMLFDALLGLGLLWLAWLLLNCGDLFKAIVLFVAFGLLMAMAWVRLDAPDVALAEVAIGAGLSGALLMSALAKLPAEHYPDKKSHWLLRLALALMLLLVASGLGYALWSLPVIAPGLSGEVATHLERSGVNHPVTAVLLNFRGYDTLLEVVVLLLALLGVWSLNREKEPRRVSDQAANPVLEVLAALLLPLLILVAAYLLWAGVDSPGGAFQAGAVLAAAGVLLLLSGWRLPVTLAGLPLRLALVAGPMAFIALAALTLLNAQLLEYPPEHAGALILTLELFAMLSIGVTLAALFLGYRPQTRGESK